MRLIEIAIGQYAVYAREFDEAERLIAVFNTDGSAIRQSYEWERAE